MFGAYVVFVVCKGGAGDMEPLATATFDLASLKPRGKWDLSETMLCIDLKPCFSESNNPLLITCHLSKNEILLSLGQRAEVGD